MRDPAEPVAHGHTPNPAPLLPEMASAGAGDGEQVVLLDAAGVPIGVADKASIHTAATPLHLAFSCYLFDGQRRVLLTRRALRKATWPGVWSNTCCGHPRPDEPPAEAVHRHLERELGTTASDLQLALANFAYRAVDPSGVVENEVCPVWVGRLASPITPDPAEVMAWTWIQWVDVVDLAQRAPAMLSPWAVLQIAQMATLGDPEEWLA